MLPHVFLNRDHQHHQLEKSEKEGEKDKGDRRKRGKEEREKDDDEDDDDEEGGGEESEMGDLLLSGHWWTFDVKSRAAFF